jgi:hypothetical protein
MADFRTELEHAAQELELAENALLCSSFHNSAIRVKAAARRARAALAQPAPEPPADGEVAEIVAELREVQDCFDIASGMEGWGPVITRAADLLERLSQPELQGPTDAELGRRFRVWWHNEGSGLPPLPGMDHEEHVRRISEIAWANGAYAARWGSPTIEPVPVSERPWERDGWCDADGKCWWGRPEDELCNSDWFLGTRAEVMAQWGGGFFEDFFPTVSLPHWALPLPLPKPVHG